jgi:two-component system cell cycle sensor histidine kinase/response regulator CckA
VPRIDPDFFPSIRRHIQTQSPGFWVLVIALGVFVGFTGWKQFNLRDELARATRVEHAQTLTLGLLPDLLRVATDLYAAGYLPLANRSVRDQRIQEASEQFEQRLSQFASSLYDAESSEKLSEFTAAVRDLKTDAVEASNESPRPRPEAGERPPEKPPERTDRPPERNRVNWRLELLREAYGDVVREYHELERSLQRKLSKVGERRQTAESAERQMAILFPIGLISLLALVGGRLLKFARKSESSATDQRELIDQLKSSESKYRSIFDNAVEGIFQTTPDGRFISANWALARMYGFKDPQDLIEKLTDIGTQLYVDPGQREALLAALQAEDVVSNLEFEVVRADGRTIWLRENVRAVRDESNRLLYLEGTVEDVSDHWWAEQRRRLQYATARVFNEAASLAEARPKILQTICEIVDWDLGAVWDVNAGQQCLECDEIWHTPEVDVADFEKANSNTTYPLGHGLAGEVWRTGEPKWIPNLAAETSFPNAAIAVKAGMGSAFGIPIKVRGEVQHVLEFFSPKISLPDPELLQTLSAISNQLGHLIERKAGEEALRASEMRKAAIVLSALDCIISYDAAGAITEFNPAAERMFARTQSEVLGRRIDEVILPEDLREFERAAFGLKEGGANGLGHGRRFELVAMRADGSEFPAEVALNRITVEGSPMYTAYLRDISERKSAERVTSELAAVVANSNDAIVSCTLDGVIRSWNDGAEKIFGYSAEEAAGRPLHMLMPADRLDEFPQMLLAVQRGESLSNYETVRLRKDGRKINVSVTDSPIRGEGGTVAGVSSIARDITERKRLEEELLQSQKMEAVGRLAGGIAHDFNNILTAILGYSDLLITQIDERHWMWKHLNEIRKASDFASSLTHQLLAFSRRQPLFPRVFCINDSVRNIEKMLQRLIGERIRIRTDLNAEIGRVKADPTQLEQVLLNLSVNARDAMPDGGTLTIGTADITYFLDDFVSANEMSAGEYVKLTISDTGVGIPPDVIKHVFEPFFTTKEKGQGTGLGLATCYGIVKQSGGYISVDSTVGSGTTFVIYLPRVEESGELASSRKEIGLLPGGSETILYVEDELTVRSLTAHVLRRLGYTVLEAADGEQARAMVENLSGKEIDLLFTDVVLPDFNGRELSDWVHREIGSLPVLFCSGYIDDNLLKRHGLGEESAFLQKPFTPSDLARKVRQVMDGVPSSDYATR